MSPLWAIAGMVGMLGVAALCAIVLLKVAEMEQMLVDFENRIGRIDSARWRDLEEFLRKAREISDLHRELQARPCMVKKKEKISCKALKPRRKDVR